MTNRLEQWNDTQLETIRKSLEHAKANRQGGLLIAEQITLDSVKAEQERRADIAYCKAHDC